MSLFTKRREQLGAAEHRWQPAAVRRKRHCLICVSSCSLIPGDIYLHLVIDSYDQDLIHTASYAYLSAFAGSTLVSRELQSYTP